MKSGFFLKTAWNNIKKNYRFYIPQMMTGTGLLACFYIVLTLTMDERISRIKGGYMLPTFMAIGTAVIALLSIILVLYTNSFLMRQRKREYGLYNVLGMEKRHIGNILFSETAISGLISVVSGLLLGILFYKLCSLLICYLFKTDIILGFYFIKPKTIILAALFFVLLYLLAFVINRITIARMKPVELLASRATGEKEPKVKWLIFLVGLATLATGYAIAVCTQNPLQAMMLFFVAVLLVIAGTYCLFTAGSIFVLKCLKRNKKYYYNKKHLPSVSGLLYRMKQNAVGLASICILATGVLVMISSTVSLYSGMQNTLDSHYPQHMYVSCDYYETDGSVRPVPPEALKDMIRTSAEKYGVSIRSSDTQKILNVAYLFDGNRFYAKGEAEYDLSMLSVVNFVTSDTYEELTGEKLVLSPDEIAVSVTETTIGKAKIPTGTVTLHGKEYRVKVELTHFPIENTLNVIAASGYYGIVVSDEHVLNEIYDAQKEAYGEYASDMTNRVAVTFEDREAASAVGEEMAMDISAQLNEYIEAMPDHAGGYQKVLDCYWDAKEAVIGMYGALLFLGIILGLVCLFATVLIIYYKQISEGYEDRERYQIMKKVGMSDDEIKRTIRSQTLLVFFLPLLTAGIHTAFAFPMLNKLLHLIMLSSTSLFVVCTLITYAFFALIYILIYSMTAKTYYKIVH